jgi:hypothetical protein|tara:strand:- start:8303 stop:8536 length:234 start_codon:yes stop_codon:yes gene_type:complete
MGFGSVSGPSFTITGGQKCPECHEKDNGNLCIDGSLSEPRNHVAVCLKCRIILCAICGKKIGQQEMGKKYSCCEVKN